MDKLALMMVFSTHEARTTVVDQPQIPWKQCSFDHLLVRKMEITIVYISLLLFNFSYSEKNCLWKKIAINQLKRYQTIGKWTKALNDESENNEQNTAIRMAMEWNNSSCPLYNLQVGTRKMDDATASMKAENSVYQLYI